MIRDYLRSLLAEYRCQCVYREESQERAEEEWIRTFLIPVPVARIESQI